MKNILFIIFIFPNILFAQDTLSFRGGRKPYGKILKKDLRLKKEIDSLSTTLSKLNSEIMLKIDSLSMHPDVVIPAVTSYMDAISKNIDNSINFIIANDSFKYFIYYTPRFGDFNQNDKYEAVIKSVYIRNAIGYNLVYDYKLNDCNFFDFKIPIDSDEPKQSIKYRQKIIKNRFKLELKDLLRPYKDEMTKIYNSKKGSKCYLNNIKVILDQYKEKQKMN